MKNYLLPSVLALFCATSAMAADYFVVVPVKGRTAAAPAESIAVSMQAATLPAAMVGQAYSYNLRDHLLVTGDKALDLNQATLTTSDTLPAGLSLAANGVLSGTPTVKNEAGASFQVVASYKTKTGSQAYTIVVNGSILQVTHIEAGVEHSCAITTEGAVKCWGSNAYGQLGSNATMGTRSVSPVSVVGLDSDVASLSVGSYHSCVVTTGGAAKCWGYNPYGQLGDNTGTNRSAPVSVTGLSSGVTTISAGDLHTCASTSTGHKCWGWNSSGQLGDNSTVSSRVPVSVMQPPVGLTRLYAGNSHTCATTSANGVVCWGDNTYGQLGTGTTSASLTPVDVQGLSSGVAQLEVGSRHSCVVTTLGGVKCWGYNANGQIGSGSGGHTLAPVNVSGLSSGVASVSAGGWFTCAVTTAGGAKCWGDNWDGELGNGTNTNSYTPVNVSGHASGVVSISAGYRHACAHTSEGARCWGYNNEGQLGVNNTSPSNLPKDVVR